MPGAFVLSALLTQWFGLEKSAYGFLVSLPFLANAAQTLALPLLAGRAAPKVPSGSPIASASATEGNSVVFTVTRTGDAQAAQSVTIGTSLASGDTASAGDFTAQTGTLTFVQGQSTQTFSVPTLSDVLLESSETFTVTLMLRDIINTRYCHHQSARVAFFEHG